MRFDASGAVSANMFDNWRDDFQIALHIQDDVRVVRPTGNLFLTNIHRVYLGEITEPSLEDDDLRDYFLAPFGDKPVGKTTDSQTDVTVTPRHNNGAIFVQIVSDYPLVEAIAQNPPKTFAGLASAFREYQG